MLIPDLKGLNRSTKLGKQTDDEPTRSATESGSDMRVFGTLTESVTASTSPPGGMSGDAQWTNPLQKRQDPCASGYAYYSCSNGFVGCCGTNPCDNAADGTCDEDWLAATTSGKALAREVTETVIETVIGTGTTKETTRTSIENATGTSTKKATASSTKKATATSTNKINSATLTTLSSSTTAPQTSTSIQPSGTTSTSSSVTDTSAAVILTASGSPTGTYSTSTISSATALASAAPSCPGGNGTTYTDSTSIAYDIRCGEDNSYDSYSTIVVDTGGYSQCFSACSYASTCAGFTYVGLDNGSCYLKEQLPTDDYVSMNGSNYIVASKVNSTASATTMSASAQTSATASPATNKNVGAIVGGTVGGVAFLALIGLGIALLARHRRKKIDEKHGTITTFMTPPHQDYGNSYVPAGATDPGHSRTGSTAHDAYAPTGGSYYAPIDARQRRSTFGTQTDSSTQDGTSETFVPDPPPSRSVPPGIRAEGGGAETLPASVFRRPNDPLVEAIPIAADADIQRPGSNGSNGSLSRRSLFVEHLDVGDSPTRPPPTQASPKWSPKTAESESPVLGRTGFNTQSSLSDEVRRRRHLLSYASSDYEGVEGNGGRESGRTTAESSPVDSSMVPSPLNGSGRGKSGGWT